MKYNLYADENTDFIPNVELAKVLGDSRDRSIHFLWNGTKQWLAMSKDNGYNDNAWLVTETDYTEEFQAWLDENLENYDSLESMFELEKLIQDRYEIKFEAGE